MIKVENVDVWGFEHAVRAMRNPMNSWNKSDSVSRLVFVSEGYRIPIGRELKECDIIPAHWKVVTEHPPIEISTEIGPNDLDLMRRLYKSGTEHRTYARMIQVSMDIVAPLYWWKDMDRYTVGKSQVGCSTMHKIAAKEFELSDFSHEHLRYEYSDGDSSFDEASWAEVSLLNTIETLNRARDLYLKSKDKKHWWLMIQLLPSSYNQKRTICMSYEVVFKIIRERTGHKLDEFNEFVEILKTLPYVNEIIKE